MCWMELWICTKLDIHLKIYIKLRQITHVISNNHSNKTDSLGSTYIMISNNLRLQAMLHVEKHLFDHCIFFSVHEAPGSDNDIGCCGCILIGLSYLLVGMFFPFSLCMTIKVSLLGQTNINVCLIFLCVSNPCILWKMFYHTTTV